MAVLFVHCRIGRIFSALGRTFVNYRFVQCGHSAPHLLVNERLPEFVDDRECFSGYFSQIKRRRVLEEARRLHRMIFTLSALEFSQVLSRLRICRRLRPARESAPDGRPQTCSTGTDGQAPKRHRAVRPRPRRRRPSAKWKAAVKAATTVMGKAMAAITTTTTTTRAPRL